MIISVSQMALSTLAIERDGAGVSVTAAMLVRRVPAGEDTADNTGTVYPSRCADAGPPPRTMGSSA